MDGRIISRLPTNHRRGDGPPMGMPLNAFAPELRELEKSTLSQLHAAIHQKDMRNSDRLLVFSHLIDRYVEERTRIVMNLSAEGEIRE